MASSQGAGLTAPTHAMSWLCWAPPGSSSPWAPVLLDLQGWGTPGCCGGPCARARECWGPICQGPDTGVDSAGIPGDCAAVRGLVQHNPSHPPWSSFAAPTPHILYLTPCSPHPELLGVPSHGDKIGRWGWHLPVPTLQAGRGRQSCVEPCCYSIIDGVTSAVAAIRAPVTSSVGLAIETRLGAGR